MLSWRGLAGGGRVALWSAVVGVVAAVATPALGQLRGGSQDLDEPPLSSEDVEGMRRILGLSDEQTEVVRGLMEAKLAEFEAGLERFEAVEEGFREDMQARRNDPELMIALLEKVGEFKAYRNGLREDVFRDVRELVLEEGQLARWDRYERHFRRQRIDEIDTGVLSGGEVDLIALVDELEGLEPETRENLEGVLRRYERELDEVIVKRIEMADEFSERQIEGMKEVGGNFMAMMDAYEKMFEETREVVAETRAITERYRRLVSAALEGEAKASFEARFWEAYVPTVYGDSRVMRAMRTAGGLESLTAEQRAELASLRERYEREAAPVNRRWAEALLEYEAEGMTMMEAFGPGGMRGEDVREASRDRRALDEKYEEMLRGLLTEEQLAELPERPTRDWREESFGG